MIMFCWPLTRSSDCWWSLIQASFFHAWPLRPATPNLLKQNMNNKKTWVQNLLKAANITPYGGRQHSHKWSNPEYYNLLQQAVTEVWAISSKCQSNYGQVRLIICHGSRCEPVPTVRYSRRHNAQQNMVSRGFFVEFGAFCTWRGCLVKEIVILWWFLKILICIGTFPLFFFFLQAP